MTLFVDISPEERQGGQPGVEKTSTGSRLRSLALNVGLPVLSVVLFLAVYQAVALSGVWSETFVPRLGSVWHAFVEMSTTHNGVVGYAGYYWWEHLYMTLRRVFVGVVIGVVAGVILGLIMGSIPWVRRLLEPWLTFLRALPPLAYFFLLVIWLGIDEAPKITLLALAALPPAAVATTTAVSATPIAVSYTHLTLPTICSV